MEQEILPPGEMFRVEPALGQLVQLAIAKQASGNIVLLETVRTDLRELYMVAR
jgi:hypothetical protein